jgi:DNA-binding transcriptional MerR regulator
MKGYVTEDDMIHRLQVIRDLVRGDKKFDADVNIEAIQRILAEEKLTSDNSDYAKCKIEAEIKRLEDNPEGDYITRISALEWALRIFAGR